MNIEDLDILDDKTLECIKNINNSEELLNKYSDNKYLLMFVQEKMLNLKELGKYRETLKIGEQFYKKDIKNETNIKYEMMSLYALLEEYQKGEEFFNNNNDNSTKILLPYAIMKYKQGKYDESKKIINEIYNKNKTIIKEIITEEWDSNKQESKKIKESYIELERIYELLKTVDTFSLFVKEIIKK